MERSEEDYKMMEDPHSYVPEHMRSGFKLWIEKGIEPGSFGMAVITNDLKGAFGRADHINKNHIGSIVAWFYNFAPSSCWGSVEKAHNWSMRFKEERKAVNEQS